MSQLCRFSVTALSLLAIAVLLAALITETQSRSWYKFYRYRFGRRGHDHQKVSSLRPYAHLFYKYEGIFRPVFRPRYTVSDMNDFVIEPPRQRMANTSRSVNDTSVKIACSYLPVESIISCQSSQNDTLIVECPVVSTLELVVPRKIEHFAIGLEPCLNYYLIKRRFYSYNLYPRGVVNANRWFSNKFGHNRSLSLFHTGNASRLSMFGLRVTDLDCYYDIIDVIESATHNKTIVLDNGLKANIFGDLVANKSKLADVVV